MTWEHQGWKRISVVRGRAVWSGGKVRARLGLMLMTSVGKARRMEQCRMERGESEMRTKRMRG